MSSARAGAARPRVLVVGAGGIGHPALWALAHEPSLALRVVDDDRVEVSNLHRLAFARDDEVGAAKVSVARRVCEEAGRDASHGDEFLCERFAPDTALALLEGCALVLEGADNFATKFLVADAAALAGVPAVHGAAVGWVGTVLTAAPNSGACYRCVYEEPPSGDALDCASVGVFGPLTSLVGALMAADVTRLLRGDRSAAGVLTSYDARTQRARSIAPRPRRDCALCGPARTIDSIDAARYIATHCDVG